MKNLSLALIPALFLAQFSQADIYVVVNQDSPATELTRKEVIDIYMGKTRSFDDGTFIQAIDQHKNSKLRETFYTTLTGKPISYVNAYWARLFFTGRSKPPIDSYKNSEEILIEIENNRRAIAYVSDAKMNSKIRVVFHLEIDNIN